MANVIYTPAKAKVIDWVNDTFKVLLLMNTTTADTEEDTEFLSGFTLLDEFDGAGYSANGETMATKTLTADLANNRGAWDAADVTWPVLSAGTRPIQGALLVKWVTNAADSPVIAFVDQYTGFPLTPTGSGVTVSWPATGIQLFT